VSNIYANSHLGSVCPGKSLDVQKVLLLLFNPLLMAPLTQLHSIAQCRKLTVFLVKRPITLLYLTFGVINLLHMLIHRD
jgi:hypothetical protein